jgi:hypothetical protein
MSLQTYSHHGISISAAGKAISARALAQQTTLDGGKQGQHARQKATTQVSITHRAELISSHA